MLIKNSRAAEYFFPNTSLEYVYFESIANSLDANATEIDIVIDIESYSKPDTLNITISDNGDGFNDKNFEKFCHVLDADDKQHKGIGRLVFINYFEKIKIDSFYIDNHRTFIFNDEFDKESIKNKNDLKKQSTVLKFLGYKKGSIKTYDYLVPATIKTRIIEHFLPRLYDMKLKNRPLQIKVSLTTRENNGAQSFTNSSEIFNVKDLPILKEKTIRDTTSLFDKFKLMYSVEHVYTEQKAITAICADSRTIHMDIISNKDFPNGYKMVFILYSDSFNGKTNNTRDGIMLDESSLRNVRSVFIKLVSEVIREEIPEIAGRNEQVKQKLQTNYPHLQGFIDDEAVGLVDKDNIINDAQSKYFNAQKELLEATELSDVQYLKSLEFSSRVLTEYVLYREKIITKLKGMTVKSDEKEIHNLIVPKNKNYYSNGDISDIYQNNAWVLDDKYMTYSVVLSDKQIEEIYSVIGVEGSHQYSETENGKPDVTIIFSDNPTSTNKVDVVIVEFKKLGLKIAKKEELVSQLKQRARRLIEYYPDKIQRIWFYGIADFDEEFRISLIEEGFVRLFSHGEILSKRQPIVINPVTEETRFADLFILSYKTMLEDAESRNTTFLRILKESIKKSIEILNKDSSNAF
ncbi:ATP-binding protein [Treponema primitia]|uniref:ATP-binding protein n=1 Tax=Treponema primitia TaxID=88058 RepID=UPI0002554DC8|nr:ATP-binding protein [Treponema primitia]